MPLPERLALATRNRGKIREILQICADWEVEWILGREAGDWPEVEESGSTYLQNALLKAHAVARHMGVPALADDSGIEVDALGGAPGPRSARFAGPGADDRANRELLIERIREVPEERRTARYRAVAACGWPDGRAIHAEGTCEGRLLLQARGTGGFGYDPIFVPDGEARTMAELSSGEKNRISHRGRAFRALRAALSTA